MEGREAEGQLKGVVKKGVYGGGGWKRPPRRLEISLRGGVEKTHFLLDEP